MSDADPHQSGPGDAPTVETEAGAADVEAASLVGRVLSDRYRVDALIARGGLGTVYRGEHVPMRKVVAIKVLHASIERHPEIVARFEREAIAGAHVQHPNVAAATDFGQLEGGACFLVLEHIEGVTLRELIQSGPLPAARAIGIARQVAAGLGAIHDKGIVHRDLKPMNVLVDVAGGDRVKVIDFGLAKIDLERIRAGSGGKPAPALTAIGMVMGTVAYMAPEAALGMDAVDARADFYALGLVLYEMLAGKHPFDATAPAELFKQQRHATPPPLAERTPGVSVPAALEALVMRLLEKSPKARPSSAAEVLDALDALAREAGANAAAVAAPIEAPPATSPSPARPAPVPASPPGAKPLALLSRRPRSGPRLPSLFGDALADASDAARRAARALGRGSGAPAWAYGALGAGALLLVGAVVLLARGPRDEIEPAAAPSAAPPAASAPPPREVVLEVDGLDAKAWRARLRATMDTRDWGRGAAAFLAIAELDPTMFREPAVREAALAAATGIALEGGDRADAVFAAMTDRLDQDGLDLLFDMVRLKGGTKGSKRAGEILRRPEVLARATPELRIAFELHRAPCAEKSALYDRAVAEGDGRTLAQMQVMREQDCDNDRDPCCFKGDAALAAAIKALKARLGK